MKNKPKIKQLLKKSLIDAQQNIFIEPILYKLMEDLEEVLTKGEKNDDTGKKEGGAARS